MERDMTSRRSTRREFLAEVGGLALAAGFPPVGDRFTAAAERPNNCQGFSGEQHVG
jgi:hypothetical protein